MLSMQITNSQVAIAGRVLNGATQQPIAGTVVEIIDMPVEFSTYLSMKELQYGSGWEQMINRPDKKVSSNEGSFYFVDLPPGIYKLQAYLPGSGTSYEIVEQDLTVGSAVNDIIPTTVADILLNPTGITGNIHEKGELTKKILNAKVQVQGTLETAFSDSKGNYSLLGLEIPKSDTVTLKVSATDYQEQDSQPITIQQGQVTNAQNFALEPQQPT